MYTYDQEKPFSNNLRDIQTIHVPNSRSKTPGPEFGATSSSASYRTNTLKPRSKTPTAYEFSPRSLQNRYDTSFQ